MKKPFLEASAQIVERVKKLLKSPLCFKKSFWKRFYQILPPICPSGFAMKKLSINFFHASRGAVSVRDNTNNSELLSTFFALTGKFITHFIHCPRVMQRSLLLTLVLSNYCWSAQWTEPQRLTHVGPDKNRTYDATEAAVAVNSTENNYLIVWEGNDDSNDLATTETEIFGKLINMSDDSVIKDTFRISFNGSALSDNYDAREPEVVFNPDNNEFVVVWYGDDDKNGIVEGEFEIFAQRVNASTGEMIQGAVRVSDMGPTANRSYDAFNPHISYNSQNKLYLVVWHGEEGNLSSPLGSFEIFGQFMDLSLNETGENDFQISNMGPVNSADYNAYSPVAAYNSVDNEFMVAWYGEDERDGRVPGEFEIYARRLDAETGILLDDDSISVSYVGTNGDVARAAKYPDIAYNSDLNEYLLVWSADDSKNGHAGNEFEIYGQALSASGEEKGKNDFIISNMGPVGSNNFDAFRPKVIYSANSEQYVVAWRGDDLVDGEFEIYNQRLDSQSQIRLGASSQRISFAGVEGSLLYDAKRVDIAHNPVTDQFLIVWEQEDESEEQTEGEFEIYSSKMSVQSFVSDRTMSGSWYDTSRSGEGYIIQVLPNDSVLVIWFTYMPEIADQAWIIGVGNIKHNRILLKDTLITSGGVFGPDFDPQQVTNQIWGDVSFEFNNCSSANISYESSIFEYSDGDHNISRLTGINGAECGSQTQNDDPLNFLTGSWYDPTHSGEGWLLEYIGNNSVVMYWFSYDDAGNQKWMLSVGSVNGDGVISFDQVTMTDGTYFGDLFNSSSVNSIPWGSLQMTINSCSSLTVDYQSDIELFGTGTLDAHSLSGIDGIECNL